ncbi:probable LRR receptor-like serine/threonine-protein kinase At4g26540 [Amborella trichopoda]|nr:probable LRR receptor-like serine/threonine-protein kinase At4g26540 [Amborella trichopoda]|eukprot:XP_006853555.2 probable LRR receptor-like serine/threonine-protein kinase At4g26540 [Amborella trichopoda]
MRVIMPAQPWPSCKTLFLSLLCLSFLNSQFALAIDEQGQALLAWKHSLNDSTAMSDWNPSDPNPCNWFGITCGANKEVLSLTLSSPLLLGPLPSGFSALASLETLILSGTNLTGPIPPQFGDYRALKRLDLSNNGLTGRIPNELCKLNNLQRLYLNSNQFEGPIPALIGDLSELQWLILYDNQFSGAIPQSIGKLQKLEVFRAGGNANLEGQLPESIGNCSSLTMLGLAETSVSGNLPATLGQLSKLQTLAIYTAMLSGPIPKELGNCKHLQSLYLYENSLSGSIPPEIGLLSELQNLLLWQNALVGVIPQEIGNCSNLEVIDLSMNMLTGSIPIAMGKLSKLQELQLSVNQISGEIPLEIANCSGLTHLEIDNNQILGQIPAEFGNLENLTLLYVWQNKLEGPVPETLANCVKLQALDLSQNNLMGSIPRGLFNLRNLTKLLLLSNELTGFLPPEIGNCSALFRFRAAGNKLSGEIPAEIGRLKSLNFLDLGDNLFTGPIPNEISGCSGLEFLDLHLNGLTGSLPSSLGRLMTLQVMDVSWNRLSGPLGPEVGSLRALSKLILRGNGFSGAIPAELNSCTRLQLLDLSSNGFSNEIPAQLGSIIGLEIALNLSCNSLSGPIPKDLSGLVKLTTLDISRNRLLGSLEVLASLQNLVTLNVSYNNFSGELPDTPFFRRLSLSDLTGNAGLCVTGCIEPRTRTASANVMRIAMSLLIGATAALLLFALYMVLRTRNGARGMGNEEDGELQGPWQMTLYQKVDVSVEDVVDSLVTTNIIGKGCSGVVYRARIHGNENNSIAVKRLWGGSEKASALAFACETSTLGAIRHRNIVRLLGYCSSPNAKLLLYDYMPNGSLGSLLHEGGSVGKGVGGVVGEWEVRYNVLLGAAQGLAYLHHDCTPPILHRDVKSNNILLGPQYEPYLADFGVAKLMNGEAHQASRSNYPQFAGSYGYIAPEYGCMLRITEKSDVYSFGVVALEVLTGKRPIDPSLPEGTHLVQWVRDHLSPHNSKTERVNHVSFSLFDPRLQGGGPAQAEEMSQALGIALLCVVRNPDERPTMRHVAALLKGIHHDLNAHQAHKLDLYQPQQTPKYPSRSNVTSSHCSFSLLYSSDDPSQNNP